MAKSEVCDRGIVEWLVDWYGVVVLGDYIMLLLNKTKSSFLEFLGEFLSILNSNLLQIPQFINTVGIICVALCKIK